MIFNQMRNSPYLVKLFGFARQSVGFVSALLFLDEKNRRHFDTIVVFKINISPVTPIYAFNDKNDFPVGESHLKLVYELSFW